MNTHTRSIPAFVLQFVDTFGAIFKEPTRQMKLLTVPMYLMCALGLSLSDKRDSDDLQLIFHMFPWWNWVMACTYMGLTRFIGLFIHQGWPWSRKVTPAMGLSIWCFLFAASVTAPNFGMGLLYLVAASIEWLLLIRSFYEKTLGI